MANAVLLSAPGYRARTCFPVTSCSAFLQRDCMSAKQRRLADFDRRRPAARGKSGPSTNNTATYGRRTASSRPAARPVAASPASAPRLPATAFRRGAEPSLTASERMTIAPATRVSAVGPDAVRGGDAGLPGGTVDAAGAAAVASRPLPVKSGRHLGRTQGETEASSPLVT